MPAPPPQDVTTLLLAWNAGDQDALSQLMPLVHAELRRLARHYLRGERPGHTLQTTALVNEAYLRLVDAQRVRWQNRAHFFAVSARLIRRILVDLARERGYKKRGGGVRHVSLDISQQPDRGLMALDEALQGLAEFDPGRRAECYLRWRRTSVRSESDPNSQAAAPRGRSRSSGRQGRSAGDCWRTTADWPTRGSSAPRARAGQ
jgi:RNA polymerase sigma-70 factor, ECF subfamily